MMRTLPSVALRSVEPGAQDRRAAPATRARSPLSLRRLRLASGLVLFGYVLTHLANHALGNVSLAAMEDGLDAVTALWLNPLGLALRDGALLVHIAARAPGALREPLLPPGGSEILQLVTGLLIPPLLVSHIAGTRVAFVTEGLDKGYAQELYAFWVASPMLGAMQVAVLVVAWVHGCAGRHFWLRLKPGFARAAPGLLALAVLVPVVALLGFAQGGRAIRAWRRIPPGGRWRPARACRPARSGGAARRYPGPDAPDLRGARRGGHPGARDADPGGDQARDGPAQLSRTGG